MREPEDRRESYNTHHRYGKRKERKRTWIWANGKQWQRQRSEVIDAERESEMLAQRDRRETETNLREVKGRKTAGRKAGKILG